MRFPEVVNSWLIMLYLQEIRFLYFGGKENIYEVRQKIVL